MKTQCIDCDPDSFAQQCSYWSEEILIAAEDVCDIENCASLPGQCVTNSDCTATNTSACAIQEDGLYAQVIASKYKHYV